MMKNTRRDALVKFDMPIVVKGTETSEITLRRPKVKDMQNAAAYSDNQSTQEIWLVSSLSGMPVSDVENLDIEDYESIQEELGKFRKSAKKRG